MNFQHTEDRRMLADTLNRFIAEQYGFDDARPDRALRRKAISREMWQRLRRARHGRRAVR